jgi:spermidine synthase
VLGTVAAGFLLLRTLGMSDTTRLAVTLNLAIGFACLWLARVTTETMPAAPRARPSGGRARHGRSAGRASPKRAREARSHRSLDWLLLVGYGVAGATSLAYEVLWTRVLVYFTGQTIYAFSTILASFLIGIALGSLLLARAADRMRDRLSAFGLLELGVGLAAAYLLLVIGRLLPLAQAARGALGGGEVGPRFAVASALMLLPTLLMGGVTPLLIRAYSREVERLGGRLGLLYAANTVGCVVGSVVAGFGLLVWLGAERGVLAVSAVNVALGLAALGWGGWGRGAKVAMGLIGLAALGGGIGLSWHPRPPIEYWSDFLHLNLKVLYYHEGSEASLAVLANPAGRRELNLNGDTTAAADYDDVVVHKMLGHVPMLLAKEPRKVLVIGFGLGSTAWAITQYPVDQVDCVELVGAERRAAKLFASENKDVLADPRFRFLEQDGRNFLLTTNDRYDVISFNAINPSFSPYLYTREFYQLCRSRLRPGGVVCAWVPTNMSRFTTLAATFRSVFPHVTLWYCNTFHAVLIATPGPLEVDLRDWAAKMARPEVKRDLAEVQLDDPVRMASTLLLDEQSLSQYTEGAQINRDDLPYVEFDTEIATPIGLRNTGDMLERRAKPWQSVVNPTGAQRAALEAYWRAFPRVAEGWGRAFVRGDEAKAVAAYDQAIALDPADPRPRYLRAMAVARAWAAHPEAFATPEPRRQAIAALEAGLRPGEMPAERFCARARAVLGLLWVQEGNLAKAREQARLMYRFTPQPAEQEMLLEATGGAR